MSLVRTLRRPATALLGLLLALVLLPSGLAAADDASLTLTGPGAPATYGSTTTYTGRLVAGGAGVPGAAVELQRAGGGGWTTVATEATDADGSVTFSRTADSTASWRLVSGAATSSTVEVPVRVQLTAAWPTDGVRAGRTTTLRGRLLPATGTLRLERKVGSSWRKVTWTRPGSDGAYRFTVTGGSPSFVQYRVVKVGDALRLGSVATPKPLDVYRLHTYVVRTRGTIHANVAAFASFAAATYADPRGWRRGHHRFQRVATGGDFTLLLSQARYLPTYSRVCSARYSCRAGRFVIINETRWRFSSPYFAGDLTTYRHMVVNHETGHWLGRPHGYCAGNGQLAPVMQQQSKGMQGCRPNGWPLPREIGAVS